MSKLNIVSASAAPGRHETPPRELASALDQAAALIEDYRWDQAAPLLESLDARFPGRPDVLSRLAQVYQALQLNIGYEDVCEQLLAVAPERPETWLSAATAYAGNRRPVLALRTLRRFLSQWPAHPSAPQARKLIPALEDAQAGRLADLDLEGSSAITVAALYDRLEALCDRGHHSAAQRVAEELLGLQPRSVLAWVWLARAHAAQGRPARAVELDEQALQAQPGDCVALADLACHLLFAGQTLRARACGQQLLECAAPGPRAELERLRALAYLGEDAGLQATFSAAHEAGRLPPGAAGAEAWHLAACAAWRLGEHAAARELWSHALELDPQLAVARDNLEDLDRPEAERHAPWPFAMSAWLPGNTLAELLAVLEAAGPEDDWQATARAAQRFLHAHDVVRALMPVLLDRGDPFMRELAFQLAVLAATPETMTMLRDFSCSMRGPDAMRAQAASAAASCTQEMEGLPQAQHEGTRPQFEAETPVGQDLTAV